MDRKTPAILACALAASLLVQAPGLSAKERRGATVVVTKLDGTQVSGELIAVRPDSLLLLSGGKDFPIGLADVRTVVRIRRSRALVFALAGATAGAVPGAVVGIYGGGGDDEPGPATIRGGIAGGAVGALAGLLINAVLTWDPRFDVAGKPDADVARFWDRLSAHSREGARPKLVPPAAPAGTGRTSVRRKDGSGRLAISRLPA